MATAVVRCVVCEIELDDSVADTSSASPDHVSSDAISANDGRCNDDSVVDDDLKRAAATHVYDTPDSRSIFQSKSIGQSLPSLPQHDSTHPNPVHHPLSVSCCVLPLETPPDRVSAPTEIPSMGLPMVIVEDSGIAASRDSFISLSQRSIVIGDVDSLDEVSVTFEPFCRICQLPGDSLSSSDSTLVSPCRCAGSLQYAHTTCLVVSHRYIVHSSVWCI